MSLPGEHAKPFVVVISGPTACGKTALALELAEIFPVEVISADSRQVYRGMDIGTAKPTPEELHRVRHHLVNVVDPDEQYTAADFAAAGRATVYDVLRRGRIPLVVGGTGLYIRALTEGLVDAPGGKEELRRKLWQMERDQGEGTLHRLLLHQDPVSAARIHPRNLVRIVRALEVFAITGRPISELHSAHAFADAPFATLKIGLFTEREELFRRIDRRTEMMVQGGLLQEVSALLEKGYSPRLKALQTIGYREVVQHLAGQLSETEAVALIQRETRRYAKRQITWFGRDNSIIWVDSCRESARIHELIDRFYVAQRSGHGKDPIQYSGPVS